MGATQGIRITWTDYLRYRAALRGFELATIEDIIRYSMERYRDTVTNRTVIVGKHDQALVLIPCEKGDNEIIPVTVHATSRQQVSFRVKTGRFVNEYD